MKKILLLATCSVLIKAVPAVQAQTWSSTGLSYPTIVYTIADYNGTLQVGGQFSTPNEMRAMCVYNGDLYSGGTNGGASTNVYKNGVSIGALNGGSNFVFAMAVYNNQLYAAGGFASINGVAANNIARWNGTVWTAAGGLNDYINAMCVYNGSLYAGGGQSGNCFKWNGTSWSVAGIFSESGGWGYIRSMGVYANELYVGGTFDTVDGVSVLNLARYNGIFWSSAGDIGVAGMGDGVSAIAEYNGELYCGGHFTVAGGTAAGGIARGNGTSWQTLGNGGTNGIVLALHVFNQSLYVGGAFDNAGGISVDNIAKWAPPCTPPAATITVQGPPVLCPPGDSILITANTGAGLTYQWKKSGNNIAGATSSGYYATTLGIYLVVVTNASGCSATSSTVGISSNTIFANIYPAGPTTFCSGGSVVLNAYVGTSYTYQWNKNGINIPGATLSSYTATTAGSYTVDETGGACTKTSLPETIVVNALPSAIITPAGSTTFCSGGSVLLNVATGTNKTFQWKKGGTNISGATLSSYTATVGGTYKVTVTNSVTGCSKTTTTGTVVTVNPLPAATITPQGPTTFCAGGSVVLQANTGAGLTYKWKKGSNYISGATLLNYTATIGGNYRVQVTKSNGCSKTSALVAVSVPCKKGEELISYPDFNISIYPNPSAGDFVFEISNSEHEKISINIYDMIGNLILSETVGNPKFTVLNSQLIPGIYSAEIMKGSNRKVIKIIKIN